MKKLIIVESPTKIYLLKKILGSGYDILASKGHIKNISIKDKVRFLSSSSIEIKWIDLPSLKSLLKEIKFNMYSEILIATDPDREGERIALDLEDTFRDRIPVRRIRFNSVTKEDVLKSLENPQQVNRNLALAARARAILDYYYGFNISPLLWKVISKAKSMGRIQGPSLKWIVDRTLNNLNREVKRERYAVVNYGNGLSIRISLNSSWRDFFVYLRSLNIAKPALNSDIFVSKELIPFNTLGIQRWLATYRSLSATKTMSILNSLYAGKASKDTGVGLITYLRTNSTFLSHYFVRKAVVKLARLGWIGEVNWRTVKKHLDKVESSLDESHEAIRPAYISLFKGKISGLDRVVYRSILLRSLASLIKGSKYRKYWLSLGEGKNIYRSQSLYELLRRGNEQIYYFALRSRKVLRSRKIPRVESVKIYERTSIDTRYPTESSLITNMEKMGVGRPSTWNNIVPTLKLRKYIYARGNQLLTENLGFITYAYMMFYFGNFMTNKFTNRMEGQLDDIVSGKDYVRTLTRMLYYVRINIRRSQGINIDWSKVLGYSFKGDCCGQSSRVYFSLQGFVALFFKCEVCQGIRPIQYKFIASRKVDDQYSKLYLVNGKKTIITDELPSKSFIYPLKKG